MSRVCDIPEPLHWTQRLNFQHCLQWQHSETLLQYFGSACSGRARTHCNFSTVCSGSSQKLSVLSCLQGTYSKIDGAIRCSEFIAVPLSSPRCCISPPPRGVSQSCHFFVCLTGRQMKNKINQQSGISHAAFGSRVDSLQRNRLCKHASRQISVLMFKCFLRGRCAKLPGARRASMRSSTTLICY